MKIKYFLYSFICVGFLACSPAEDSVVDMPNMPVTEEKIVAQQPATHQINESEKKLSNQKIKQSQVKDLMGTYVAVDVCVSDEDMERYHQTMDTIWKRLGYIHWNMSTYSDRGDVYEMNHAQGKAIEVGADTYDILQTAQRFYELSGGAFDITVVPLIDFWKHAAERDEFPLSMEVRQAKEYVGMDHVALNSSNHVLIQKGVQVDLGGVAKGYAVDEVVRLLKENQFDDFLVDAGGDVYVGGFNCKNLPWHIGIRDPKTPTGLHGVVAVSDQAVTTSGDYEQFLMIRGQKLSHIINPITGYPQKGVVSATVIAPKAAEADALSTALAVMGPQKGLPLIDQLGDDYAALVLFQDHPEQEIQEFSSESFEKFQAKVSE